MNNTFVVIKTSFIGFHAWETCHLEEVMFLKQRHRHIFHVTVKWKVTDADRELEFFVQQQKVNDYIQQKWPTGELGSMSCEMIAKQIGNDLRASYVSVFEDDENGAEVIWK